MTEEKAEFTIPVTIQVERFAVASAVISAVEYGIYYWAREADGVIPDEVRASLSDEELKNLREWGDIAFAAVTPGCHVELVEHGGDEGDGTPRKFDHASIVHAIGVIAEKYRWHLRTILDGGDSESGDVLVQLAALGDVVYG